MENNIQLKNDIQANGLKIGFIEQAANMPKNTLYNYINQGRPIPPHHIEPLKEILKKYEINFVV